MCILNCADDNPSSISIALIPALSENTESKSLAIRDKFWVKFQNNCKLIGDSFIKSWFKVDLHFNFLITGTFEVFICLLNDKRIETYFLMTNHFRFQKLVFYWLKPVPRPAVCFVEFLCCGKKAQNWGFEITNVRYGHQAAFCSHFNDGSNSCFQTTNWIATLLHGNGHFGQHLRGLFLHLFP